MKKISNVPGTNKLVVIGTNISVPTGVFSRVFKMAFDSSYLPTATLNYYRDY